MPFLTMAPGGPGHSSNSAMILHYTTPPPHTPVSKCCPRRHCALPASAAFCRPSPLARSLSGDTQRWRATTTDAMAFPRPYARRTDVARCLLPSATRWTRSRTQWELVGWVPSKADSRREARRTRQEPHSLRRPRPRRKTCINTCCRLLPEAVDCRASGGNRPEWLENSTKLPCPRPVHMCHHTCSSSFGFLFTHLPSHHQFAVV